MRFIWLNGVRSEWDDARVHVWDEVAIRGVSAFEGIICVWRADLGRHVVVAYERHMRRMQRSASLIDLPLPFDSTAMDNVLREAMTLFPHQTFYVRPTAYVLKGRSSRHSEHSASWFVGAFPVVMEESEAIVDAGIMWPARSGAVVPPDAKTGGSYLDFRLAEYARSVAGHNASLMVDRDGNVVEADGSGLIVIDNGEIIAPPISGLALDSITRRILIELAQRLGRSVQHRHVHWSGCHGAVLLLGGTLAGVRLARLVGSKAGQLDEDLALAADLRRSYYEMLRSAAPGNWVLGTLE